MLQTFIGLSHIYQSMKKALVLLLFCSIVWVSESVSAAVVQRSATQWYAQGYNACVEANRLRYTDINAAEQNYQIYLINLQQALKIDKKFIQSANAEIKNHLAYCERVSENLVLEKSHQALAKSLTTCFAVEQAIDDGAINQAKQLWADYQTQKQAALRINREALKSSAMNYRLTQCDKLAILFKNDEPPPSQISLPSSVKKLPSKKQSNVQALFVEAQRVCLSAKVIVDDKRFQSADAEVVKYALTMSQRLVQQGQAALGAISVNALDPQQAEKIHQALAGQMQCVEQVTARLKRN